MGFREELQKRIDKKRSEITALEGKLKEAQIYIQALEDTIKLIPRENEDGVVEPVSATSSLREGSMVARAKEELAKAGRPLHISELLTAIGKPTDKDNRTALAGSIGAYVRKGEFFTRPAPNTFGLIDMKSAPLVPEQRLGPPANFGIDPDDEALPIEEEPDEADAFAGL